MNAVKTRGDWLVQLGRAPRQDEERCDISKNLVRHHWLRLGRRRLGADDIRRSRAVDWGVRLGRLDETARDVEVIRRSRESVATHAVRKHRSAPAGAADDLGSIHGCATQGVIHHFRQLRCSECADDCATREKERVHGVENNNLGYRENAIPVTKRMAEIIFSSGRGPDFPDRWY